MSMLLVIVDASPSPSYQNSQTPKGNSRSEGNPSRPRNKAAERGGRNRSTPRRSEPVESPLLMEQKKLLRLLQESIEKERKSSGHHRRRKGSKTTENFDILNRHGDEARSTHGLKNRNHPAVSSASHRPNDGLGRTSRRRRPLVMEENNESDTSSSDDPISPSSDMDSSSCAQEDVGIEGLRDGHRRETDESLSSLESHSIDHKHGQHRKANGYHPENGTYRDNKGNSKKSSQRIRYTEPHASREGHNSRYSAGVHSTQTRYRSPGNTSSTVAAARMGISHNFFELYGGKPGGVRVPDKVKLLPRPSIGGFEDKVTPIRNGSGGRGARSSSRDRLASPTVASGRRFHTPEDVRARRGESADGWRQSGSYGHDTGGAVTDAAEWSRLTDWLGKLKLQKYAGLFRRSGITKLSLVELLRAHDLAEIGIDINDHPRLLQSIQEFSHRTISFSEDALSPKQDPPSTRDRPRTLNSTAFYTAEDALAGREPRNGTSYRPLSKEGLLRLGSPERGLVEPPHETSNDSNGSAAKTVPVLSRSHEVPSTAPFSYNRLFRSVGDLSGGKDSNASVKVSISSVLNSAPRFTPVSSDHIKISVASGVPTTGSRVSNKVVEATLLSINKAFWLGDEELFYNIWKTVTDELYRKSNIPSAMIYAAHLLELFSHVYFVTWPQRPQSLSPIGESDRSRARFRAYVDRVLASPDLYSVLLKSREFATFVGIGMLPNPASNAAYSSLFKAEWADGLARRLNSYLSEVLLLSLDSNMETNVQDEPPIKSDHVLSSTDIILGSGDMPASIPVATSEGSNESSSGNSILEKPDAEILSEVLAVDEIKTALIDEEIVEDKESCSRGEDAADVVDLKEDLPKTLSVSTGQEATPVSTLVSPGKEESGAIRTEEDADDSKQSPSIEPTSIEINDAGVIPIVSRPDQNDNEVEDTNEHPVENATGEKVDLSVGDASDVDYDDVYGGAVEDQDPDAFESGVSPLIARRASLSMVPIATDPQNETKSLTKAQKKRLRRKSSVR